MLLNYMSSWDRQAVLEDYAQRLAAAEDPDALMRELGSPVVVASRLGRGYVPSPSPYAPPEPEPEPEPEEEEEEELPPLPPREKPEKPKDENSFASLAELLEAASSPEFWEENAWGGEPKLETFQLEPEAEAGPEEDEQPEPEPQPEAAEEPKSDPAPAEAERWTWDPEELELVPAQPETPAESEPEPEKKTWTWSWGEATGKPARPEPEEAETPPEGGGEEVPPQPEQAAQPAVEPEALAAPEAEPSTAPEPEAPAAPEASTVSEPEPPTVSEPEPPAAETGLGAFIDPAAFPTKTERFEPEPLMQEPDGNREPPFPDEDGDAEAESLPGKRIPKGGLTQFLLRCLFPGLPTVLGILALGLPCIGLGLFGAVYLLRLGGDGFHLYRLWSDRLLLIGTELPVLALCLALVWLGLWIILRLLGRWSRRRLCPWWRRWIAGQED